LTAQKTLNNPPWRLETKAIFGQLSIANITRFKLGYRHQPENNPAHPLKVKRKQHITISLNPAQPFRRQAEHDLAKLTNAEV